MMNEGKLISELCKLKEIFSHQLNFHPILLSFHSRDDNGQHKSQAKRCSLTNDKYEPLEYSTNDTIR